jgi:hypothetical protein
MIFLSTSQQLRGSLVNKFTRPNCITEFKKNRSLLHVYTVCLTGQSKGKNVQTQVSVKDGIIVISWQCISLHLLACKKFF